MRSRACSRLMRCGICRSQHLGIYEGATPDLVELPTRLTEATNRRDVDAIVAFYAPHAVWDMSPMGMGTFEGQPAVRGFMEDWD